MTEDPAKYDTGKPEPDTPEVIYLIPDHEDGYIWCDDTGPGGSGFFSDAVKYIRADKVEVK